jgi:hypothetical protein
LEARRSQGLFSRRALLGGSAAALLVPATMAAGCTPAEHVPPPVPGPQVNLLTSVMANEQRLVALYMSVLAAHPRLAQDLRPLHDHHSEHLAVLKQQYIPGTNTESPSPGPTTPAAAPGSVSASLTTLRTAERQAAAARAVDVTHATPDLAQLLAAIGACEAVHVAILAGVS